MFSVVEKRSQYIGNYEAVCVGRVIVFFISFGLEWDLIYLSSSGSSN